MLCVLSYSKVEYEENLRETSIDRDIWKVIYEETAAYFAGGKSARRRHISYRAGCNWCWMNR